MSTGALTEEQQDDIYAYLLEGDKETDVLARDFGVPVDTIWSSESGAAPDGT